MKKEFIYKFLYVVTALLAVGFCVHLWVDWRAYCGPLLTSAPFWLYVVVRAVEFLLPALIVFVAARIVKRKIGK